MRRGAGVLRGDVLTFLDAGDVATLLSWPASRLAAAVDAAPPDDRIPAAEVRMLTPVQAPDKILGIGMNYADFLKEAHSLGIPAPASPLWFDRARRCLAGPGDAVWLPPDCDDLDYEGELVAVIGRTCLAVSRERAHEVVGGYTIGNDITLRRRAMISPLLGKSYDTHAPVGPVVVTHDELRDPHRLALRTYVNGELRQQGCTADMVLDVFAQVQALSEVMTLSPGDLIFTGTPAGCGLLMRPPRPLAIGDVVRVEIDGIGALENTVVPAPALEAAS